VHPAVARGTLVYSDGPRLSAVNLFTGQLQWEVPARTDVQPRGRTNLSTLLSPVIADGVVYAALEVPVPYADQQLQGVPITYYLPKRRLIAVDLDSGAILWKHDEDWANVAGKLTVSSPPLVRGDRVYVAASRSTGTFENWLVALDRRTGKRVYATRISDGQQELNLFGRQLQEAFATPIAERNGVLYYGTNMGIVAAVDALLGTPIWATAYPIVEIPSTYYWFEAPRRWNRLDNGPPVVSDDTVVFCPGDGLFIMGLDTRNGNVRWRIRWNEPDGPARTLIGADEDRVYVSGSDGVSAYLLKADLARDKRAGELAWTAPLDDSVLGVGRGVLSENGLWVATAIRVHQIDPKTGRELARYERTGRDEEALVHLVSGDGVLVTAGRDFLCARFNPREVLGRAKERVRASPQLATAHVGAADIYLAAGHISEAVEHYRLAARRAEASGQPGLADRARRGLHRALLKRAEAVLETTPQRAPGEFEAAFRAAPDERTRLRARLFLDAALEVRGDESLAEWRLKNLRAIAKEFGDATLDGSRRSVRGDAMRRTADLLIELGRIKRGLEVLHSLLEFDPHGEDGRSADRRIASVIVKHGRSVYDPYEKRAQRLFQTALGSDDLVAVERGLRLYANAACAIPAMLELARRRLARGDADEASRVLQRFLAEHGASPDAPEALTMMVRALHARGSHGLAYAALLRLKTRYGDSLVTRADGARVPARDLAGEWLKRDPYPSLARSAERNDLQSNLGLRFTVSFANEDQYVDIPRLEGQRPDTLRNTVLLRISRQIVVVDSKNGNEMFRLNLGLGEPKGPLVLAGNRLHAVTERFIHVFNLENRTALPRVRVPDHGRAERLFAHQGQVFLSYRERGLRGRPGLAALHPEDGSVLWARRLDVGRRDPRSAEYFTVPHADRLLVFATHPVSVTSVDATSGAVDNHLELAGVDDEAKLQVEPHVLADGRVLLGLGTATRFDRWQYRHSYEVRLVDPADAAEAATIWKHRSQDGRARSRLLHAMLVMGQHVVAVDRERGAVVLDLRNGNKVAEAAELRLADKAGERPEVGQVQSRDDALLLIQTGSKLGRRPARLAAFRVPDLERRYLVELTDGGRETALLIPSQGIMGFKIQGPTRRIRPVVRLFDPTSARLVQEIAPAAGQVQFFTSRVQNGILLVTTSSGRVFGYAPR
ncbi:MAG: PQQ-binding-like beta-propeller repeat protein, partial [Planctomycetota bacterium]|nr:PQQ-binding-like beta-propeller repeat protein [Planctomycetota bacterium]